MADNIIRFDRFHRIKRKLPGSRTPDFHRAYNAATGFLLLAQANVLSCGELTHIAAKLPQPVLHIVHSMLKELQDDVQHDIEAK